MDPNSPKAHRRRLPGLLFPLIRRSLPCVPPGRVVHSLDGLEVHAGFSVMGSKTYRLVDEHVLWMHASDTVDHGACDAVQHHKALLRVLDLVTGNEEHRSLIANPVPGAPVPPILPPQNGFLFLDRAKFADSFAADVAPVEATFMADSQVPWGVNALNGAVTEPAWKSKRSWYLVSTDDKMIPPPAQRQMAQRANLTVTEIKGSHAVYVSQPQAVIKLIEQAAKGTE
jgi:hypothetical protein